MSNTQMDFMLADLKRSGLIPTDLRARPLDETERVACALNNANTGYVIPYFDIQSKPMPFYRARLEQGEMKYKQVRNSVNHVYFPFGFMSNLIKTKSKQIIIVEGEKKAVALQKAGFPAIAFGGVDSWRNRALILPKDTQFTKMQYQEEQIKAAIPAGEEALEFNIRDNSPVVGIPLAELNLKSNLLVCCLARKGTVRIPRGQDTIQVGDNVVIVTTNKGLRDIRDILA